ADLAQLRRAVDDYRVSGNYLWSPYFLALLVTACLKHGALDEGLRIINGALDMTEAHGSRMWDAEFHRLRGELLLPRDPAAGPDAEAAFRRAIDTARAQNAKSWELRAGLSLSRLWRRQGKREEAHQLLSGIYGWFTEGFDTADLRAAKALLYELSA